MKKTVAIGFGLAALLVTGYASAATMSSGRPSAVLSKKDCKVVWKAATGDADYLTPMNAGPYIVNWTLADANGDGKITKREFKKACSKGLVKGTVVRGN